MTPVEVWKDVENYFNNNLINLEWVTRKGNAQHALSLGLYKVGENAGRAKLTQLQVNEIRELYSTGGVTQDKLATRFGVAQSVISSIIRLKLWRNK